MSWRSNRKNCENQLVLEVFAIFIFFIVFTIVVFNFKTENELIIIIKTIKIYAINKKRVKKR